MKFFKKIFSNFPAKIISLLIALAIWIYIGSIQAQTGNFPGDVPIEFQNVLSGLVATTDQEKVTVKIVAEPSIFKKLSADSFSATIDLSNFKEGTYELPVKVTANLTGVQIVEINPEKIILRLEKIAEKEIPVVLQAQGQAAEGFVVGDWKISPERVKVAGAESVVQKILEATAKVTLSEEKESFKRIVKVIAFDASGNEIKNLKFTPTEVEADIPLVRTSSAKTVGIKVNTSGLPAEGFWISRIETEPSTVAITASSQVLPQISFLETKEIDINNLSGAKEQTTTLKIPANVTILENINLIKVKITASPINTTKQVKAGFSFSNLNSSLKVAGVDPSTVTLVVSGSAADLAQMNQKEISINLDLTSFDYAGTYSAEISRNNIGLPAGISFSSVVPSAVTVRLEAR